MPNKPIGQYEIDWSHPLTTDLETVYINENQLVKNIGKSSWPDINTGISLAVNTSNGVLSVYNIDTSISLSFIPVSPPFTIHARVHRVGNWAGGVARTFGFYSTSGDELVINVGTYDHKVTIRYNYGTLVILALDGGVNSGDYSDLVNDIFLVCHSDGDYEAFLYVDGALQDSSVSSNVVGGFTSYNRFTFGATSYGGAPVEIGTHFSKSLTELERLTFIKNPYQFLKPVRSIQDSVYPALFGSAGGTTIAIPKSDIAVTSHAASLAITENFLARVVKSNLALTTYAPDATASDHKAVEIGKTNISLTSHTPIFSNSDLIVVNVGKTDIDPTSYTPMISVTNHQAVAVDKTDLTFASYTPTANVTANVSFDIPAQNLILNSHTPTVTTTEHVFVDIGKTDIPLISYIPSDGAAADVRRSTMDMDLQLSI